MRRCNAVVQWLDNNQLANRDEYECYERKSKNVAQKIRGAGQAGNAQKSKQVDKECGNVQYPGAYDGPRSGGHTIE